MIYVIIGLGLLLIVLGLVINVNNARYLLSGYNTMSEENRKKVDIHNLIPCLKKFQLFLGISLIIVGVNLVLLFGEVVGALFLAVYPIVAYVYLIIYSRKFSPGLNHTRHWVSAIALVATLVFLGYQFFVGLREDRLIVKENTIVLEGRYGFELDVTDVRSVGLVEKLPPITMKDGGFALEAIRKGYFRTSDGERVRLILNSVEKPYILITLTSGDKIYYASRDVAVDTIYNQIRGSFPQLVTE
jgi:hypothetical protein